MRINLKLWIFLALLGIGVNIAACGANATSRQPEASGK
jgi:hypothetical protein